MVCAVGSETFDDAVHFSFAHFVAFGKKRHYIRNLIAAIAHSYIVTIKFYILAVIGLEAQRNESFQQLPVKI